MLFCVEINSARSLACEDKTDKYEVRCHNFIFTFCLIVRHNRNMLPFLLYIFPVNHSRPALMGCSMTTSKLGGGSHVNDWLPSTPPSLHTKHLVFSCSMLLEQSFHNINIARIANAVQCYNCKVKKIVMNPGYQLSVL